ncbi:4-oxalocrotonate tautomerase family protein [Bradyrhizobium sp. CCBAU 53421]|uniref:tautomerase family protein n=1 Tax=Bradyrhizobium sp. CCBAU 53421 TaxID=1325120 RepID=UPI00188AD5F6|nr:4-oxalocrotonate tautomerase family protein [Bradyrhizobium sp. CCBAU 53421]QOZ36492.1 4-oxalocrotonate tautomerase [Bradyrhizobium sp. CCBAU 53421]
MPVITIDMLPGRTTDQKQEFANVVTDAFVRICGSTPSNIHVIFNEIEGSDWFIAGVEAGQPVLPQP